MFSLVQLETLSSSGLVRRAQKALTKNKLLWLNKSDIVWDFSFETSSGQLNIENPEASRCDCPATGLCKHIIAAAITSIDENSSEAFVAPQFDLHKLFSEAGKAACRSIFQQWQKQWSQIFSKQQIDREQSNRLNTEPFFSCELTTDHCLLIWGEQRATIGSSSGLSAITTESGTPADKLMAAILYTAYREEKITWPDWLSEELQLKDQQENNLVKGLKENLKKQLIVLSNRGLQSILPANLVEMLASVPDLKAAGEVRLGNGILSLAEWVERRSSKQGLDPVATIRQQIVNLYAQCESTASFKLAEPEQFKKLNLCCLGGHKWINSSGATGLSMVFISEAGDLYSASIVRNQQGHGFNLQQAWSQQNLWTGAPINDLLPGQYFSLHNARLNHWQSLSLSSKTEYRNNAELSFQWQAITDWQQLKSVAEYSYALLSVKRWLSCDFDEVQQVLLIHLQDENNQILVVRQQYSENTEHRITTLIDHWKQQAKYLLVRYVYTDSQHVFEPVAMYLEKWISLDFMKVEKARVSLLSRIVSRFRKNEEIKYVEKDELMNLLSTLESKLTDYPYCDTAQLNMISERLEKLGLYVITEKLKLIDDAEQFLQLLYCISMTKKLNSGWPIFDSNDTL